MFTKSCISFILYGILFWLLLGYIVLPICNTFVQAFKSENGYSLNVIKDYLSNPNNFKAATILPVTLVPIGIPNSSPKLALTAGAV